MIHRVALLIAIAAAGCFPAEAQSAEPTWTELPSSGFTFVSFAETQAPDAAPPYGFVLPDPVQPRGGWSVTCNARENPNVDLYHYDTGRQIWIGPLAGPVYRSPTDSFDSSFGTGWKGIAAQLSFSGRGSAYNGNTIAEAVFFHNEPCYRAASEFGFFRYVRGLPGDETIYFYYEINANCTPSGKCRVHGTDQILSDQQVAIALPGTPASNSAGGGDWLYMASLVSEGAQWRIQIVDPYTLADAVSPLTLDVQAFFDATAAEYYGQGASGYITATSTRSGLVPYSGETPVMKVAKILALQ